MTTHFSLKQKRTIPVHSEFIMQNYCNGVRVTAPKSKPSKPYKKEQNGALTTTVQDLLDLPVNVYFLNSESRLQESNIPNAISCGFNSYDDAIGRSSREIPAPKETTDLFVLNDNKTMTTGKTIVADESGIIKTCVTNITSIKIPWYDEYEKIIGVIGFSIPYGNLFTPNLLSTLQVISNLGILNPSIFSSLQNNEVSFNGLNVRLSKREQDCIFHLKQGKSIKRIALALDLSPRTVQHYIDNIKIKFNVTYMSELIEIILQL